MSRPPSRMRAMAPPPPRRGLSALRQTLVTPSLSGRQQSPAMSAGNSMRSRSPNSVAGPRRKEQRDSEISSIEGETNISVFVRCRGRNDREVKENSGVVITTDGVKGKTVEITMGPHALSNKTYTFDRVFSPAADQIMIFDEVVTPILDEVLSGFNCTIFAYGQTGTGKTYTMSGEISDQYPLPENAGIVPRVLGSLFSKLDSLPNSPSTDAAPETSVKISFIELYNEELRDLLAVDESVKLKIVDGDSKRGAATLVHGMEETYITSAGKGIQLLRSGSHKRQVAATKCNDLSSRSHTVFTVTVHTKRRSESGEEVVCIGKLNLVDLAGSENIQRSGAENKRAAEAGLINKSLLTLGRVINSLVDHAPHIPYRESKLTRLLQDSLGGRTKTCIIATISPARSNLEETIPTLDYAFRAKNIRNKPQVNQLLSKKTLLKEYTIEIEKLKSELMATRRKNGVYLTQESYDEMNNESESRRTQIKDQLEKIETIEYNLNRKIQELFVLTSTVTTLKKDNETTKSTLDSTKDILVKTEAILAHTNKCMDDEVFIRQQHEKTEARLIASNQNLITAMDQSTDDIAGLHAKMRRKSDMHSMNRQHWSDAQKDVSDVTSMVEDRLQEFQDEQQALMGRLSTRMHAFVQDELQNLQSSRQDLKQMSTSFDVSHKQVEEQTAQSKKRLENVLGEIKVLREDVKSKVGVGLNDLGIAAQRISAGILSEIETFHSQLHISYSALGRDFKSTFDDLTKEISEQREELDALRLQMSTANQRLQVDQSSTTARFVELVNTEKELRDQENQDLMAKIQQLMDATNRQQDIRLQAIGGLPSQYQSIREAHSQANEIFTMTSNSLMDRSEAFGTRVTKSKDSMKLKLQADFATANKHTDTLREITSSVHEETTRIVKEQEEHLDHELQALDGIVDRVQEQNNTAHVARQKAFKDLANNAQTSYKNVEQTFSGTFDRVESLKSDISETSNALQDTIPTLDADSSIRKPLTELRERREAQDLDEYVSTGHTPSRKDYSFSRSIPKTACREVLLDRLHNGFVAEADLPKSPSKALVFIDEVEPLSADQRPSTSSSHFNDSSLRELDINAMGGPALPPIESMLIPSLKRSVTGVPTLKRPVPMSALTESKVPSKKRGALRSTMAVEGFTERENLTMPNLSASVGLGVAHPGIGRRLRSRDRQVI